MPVISFLVMVAVLGIPWLVDTVLQSLPLSSHSIFPGCQTLFLQGHQSYWIKVLQYKLILIHISVIFAKALFSNKVIITGDRD